MPDPIDEKDQYEVLVAFGKVDDLHGQVKWVQYSDGTKVYYDDKLSGFRDGPLEDIDLLGVGSVDVLVYKQGELVFYCPHVNCRRICP